MLHSDELQKGRYLRRCYTRQFSLQPVTQRLCEASCRRNCVCNTTSLPLCNAPKTCEASCTKVEQSSTFRNVPKPFAVCNISTATRFAMYCCNYGASGRISQSKLSFSVVSRWLFVEKTMRCVPSCEKSCKCLTSTSNLQYFFVVNYALQVTEKTASRCNRAFTVGYKYLNNFGLQRHNSQEL